MPIEIKEMHIKINVSKQPEPSSQNASKGEDSMIQECLDQMAKMLNDKDER